MPELASAPRARAYAGEFAGGDPGSQAGVTTARVFGERLNDTDQLLGLEEREPARTEVIGKRTERFRAQSYPAVELPRTLEVVEHR